MKLSWKIATPFVVLALICGALITWHFAKSKIAERKLAETLNLTRVRAQQGDAEAQSQLAHMYYHGFGVPQNYAEAARWYQKAADQGNAKAEYAIGYMHKYGQAMPQDSAEAIRWCLKAADHGDAMGQYFMGRSYRNGEGVPQDYLEAARWYRKSADQNNAEAQYVLGYMEYNGQGVAQDYVEAARLYRKAADQGNAMAQSSLGYMYAEGQGVTSDRAEVVRLFRAAAKQGDKYAQDALSSMKLRFTAFDKIRLMMAFAFCLVLLFRSRLNFRNRQQRMLIIGAVSGFLYIGLSVYGQFHFLTLRAWSLVNTYRITTALVAGISCGLLLPIAWPRGHNAFLWICGILLIAFNVFIFTVYHFRDGRAFYSTNAVLAGLAITTIVLHVRHRGPTEEISI